MGKSYLVLHSFAGIAITQPQPGGFSNRNVSDPGAGSPRFRCRQVGLCLWPLSLTCPRCLPPGRLTITTSGCCSQVHTCLVPTQKDKAGITHRFVSLLTL